MINPPKFRVWDILNKRMFSFEEVIATGIHISSPDGRNYNVPLLNAALVDGKHKFIVQMFINQIDNEGKEIYDGDILLTKTYDDWFDEEGYEHYMEVKLEIKPSGQSISSGYLFIPTSRKVVGNIFETPQLLTTLPTKLQLSNDKMSRLSCPQCHKPWDGKCCIYCNLNTI